MLRVQVSKKSCSLLVVVGRSVHVHCVNDDLGPVEQFDQTMAAVGVDAGPERSDP